LLVWRVETIPIHGGSLRLFVSHRGAKPIEGSVSELLEEERAKGVPDEGYYKDFASRVEKLKEDLRALVSRFKAEGKRVAAYGASAKGSTLLNYYGIGRELLEFVADRSTYKQGRLTPGMHLPIVPAEALLEQMPDYTVLLTWNFAEEILKQQQEYRERGGRFIIPIPEVKVV
jgi:hypothetical protein